MARYVRPRRCRCGKNRYSDEAAALAAINRKRDHYGSQARVYLCPGSTAWHIATRGFHPHSLQSMARIIAWHVDHRRVIDSAAPTILRDIGLTLEDRRTGTTRWRRYRKILRQLVDLGLVRLDEPRPGYVTVANRAGLVRVLAVGLDWYAHENLPAPTEDTAAR